MIRSIDKEEEFVHHDRYTQARKRKEEEEKETEAMIYISNRKKWGAVSGQALLFIVRREKKEGREKFERKKSIWWESENYPSPSMT
jgi:hypothetical protein